LQVFAIAVIGAFAVEAGAQNIRRARPLLPGEVRPVRDGLSWDTAYVNLQDALNFRAAQSLSSSWEVWVAGKHVPPASTRTQAGVARTETFRNFRRNTTILGGFNGTETGASQRSPALYRTILSGDVDNDDTFLGNTWTLVTIGNIDGPGQGTVDITLVFDGLTLEAGAADTVGRHTGACVNFFSGYSARFVNCTLRNNRAGSAGATNGQGAAVVLQNTGAPVFESCTFQSNQSNGEGGAVWINGATNGATFQGCIFDANEARLGAAIYNYGSPVTLTNCVFTSNSAALQGGAVLRLQGGSVTATGCMFSTNTAGVVSAFVSAAPSDFAEGGALSLQSTEAAQATDRFTDCRFEFNTTDALPGPGKPWVAASNRGAGAVHHINGALKISRCVFLENVLPQAGNAQGAAIRAYSSAPNNYTHGSNITIDRSIFQDNAAPSGRGGAVNTFRGRLAIYSSVFFRNTALSDGSAVFYDDPPIISGPTRAAILVANSLFHANGCVTNQTGTGCLAAANGVVAAQGDSEIINCTVQMIPAQNSPLQPDGVGGDLQRCLGEQRVLLAAS